MVGGLDACVEKEGEKVERDEESLLDGCVEGCKEEIEDGEAVDGSADRTSCGINWWESSGR
jgi:hypothetical protein